MLHAHRKEDKYLNTQSNFNVIYQRDRHHQEIALRVEPILIEPSNGESKAEQIKCCISSGKFQSFLELLSEACDMVVECECDAGAAGTVRIVPDTFTAHASDAGLGNSDLPLSTTNASLQKAIRHLDALAYKTGHGVRHAHCNLTLHRQADRKSCDLMSAMNILFSNQLLM